MRYDTCEMLLRVYVIHSHIVTITITFQDQVVLISIMDEWNTTENRFIIVTGIVYCNTTTYKFILRTQILFLFPKGR